MYFVKYYFMKDIVSERLSQIIKALDTNMNRLANDLDFKNSVIGNVVNQRNLPSFDFIYRLKQYDKRINLNWFIAGEGKMFNDDNIENQATEDNLKICKELIDSLKRENILLRDKIDTLLLSNDCKKQKTS